MINYKRLAVWLTISLGLLVGCKAVSPEERVVRLPTQEYRVPVTFQIKEDHAWLRVDGKEYRCEQQ